ncbi:MAG: phage/plasmid replication protein [Pyrinomonadaceae bacterium]|nr:phage/plasmid replication protein [Pyrinomonadaceae bacterium]
MLDTVRLKHYFLQPFGKDDLRRRGAIPLPRRNLNSSYILRPCADESTLPPITIYQDPRGKTHVEIELSIPKLLFRHNAKLPNQEELCACLNQLTNYVSSHIGRPFTAMNAAVSRVDYTRDIFIGNSGVITELRRLRGRRLARCTRQTFEDTTIYFTSKAKTFQVRIYSKLDEVIAHSPLNEMALIEAAGILRFEICLKNRRTVVQRTKHLHPASLNADGLLTQSTSDQMFDDLFHSLDWQPGGSECIGTIDSIMQVYPGTTGLALLGYLQAIEHYGGSPVRLALLGIRKATYYRNKRRLKDCGIII